MADEEVKDEKYELILQGWLGDARSAEWKLECGVGFGASSLTCGTADDVKLEAITMKIEES
jgi:hypothetical protein